MERIEIIEKLTSIFRTVFEDNSITLKDDMTANDVPQWDSLTHMQMITEVEKLFEIRFKLKELKKLDSVGDLVAAIETKLA